MDRIQRFNCIRQLILKLIGKQGNIKNTGIYARILFIKINCNRITSGGINYFLAFITSAKTSSSVMGTNGSL
jgi:hypothetical protein